MNQFDLTNYVNEHQREVESLQASVATLDTSVAALTADNPLAIKVYVGAITQSSTSTPTLTEVLNTTGATVTASYGGVGKYRIKFSTSVLTASKTHCEIPGVDGANIIRKLFRSSATLASLWTASGTAGNGFASVLNALVTKTVFRITVYP